MEFINRKQGGKREILRVAAPPLKGPHSTPAQKITKLNVA